MRDENFDWTLFLNTPPAALIPDAARTLIAAKRILITGAGGSIGSALARALASLGVKQLLLLDIAEHGLFDLDADLPRHPPSDRRLIVGDICDPALLRSIFTEFQPHIVFHAAACKHVSLMEANPFTAARTNVIGTHRILTAANAARVGQVIVLSTDKAVDPIGIMGATKRLSELLTLANAGPAHAKAVRLPNVLGSSGSVGPVFLHQIARAEPLTVTDPACTRHFLTIDQVVHHLLSALAVDSAPGLLIPEVHDPVRILDLAHSLLRRSSATNEIIYTGLRPGEKQTERMLSSAEAALPTNIDSLRQLTRTSSISPGSLQSIVDQISSAVETRNLRQLLDALNRAIPEYQPSTQLTLQLHEAEVEACIQ